MTILLENATLVNAERSRPVLPGRQVLIQDRVISAIGRQLRLRRADIQERLDCAGKLVIPGLINAHSHLLEILQRSFRDNVRKEVWISKRQMTEQGADLTDSEIGAAAALACAEMLKSGVTAVVDHFSLRSGITAAKMISVLDAFQRTGIRGVLAPSLRDQNFLDLISSRGSARKPARNAGVDPWQTEMLLVLEHLRNSSSVSSLMLGPSSPQNCSDALLRQVVRTAERYDLGIHTHLLETVIERWGGRRLYRNGMVQRMKNLGLLSSRLSVAHGVWLDDREMDLLAASGASLVHNPASNLKLGSGRARIADLMKRGVNVALGTDGGDTSDSYSIFDQMRLAAFLSRLDLEPPERWVTAADALRMATTHGANAIPAWRGKIGSLRVGYRADIVILKPQLRLQPLNDFINQLVYCENGQSVDTVLVDGRVVVRGGSLTGVDEQALVRAVAPLSEKMFRIYGRIKRRRDGAEAAIERFYRNAVGTRLGCSS
jgi:5-methylthioadenosine/S-adenosylhomocysteine deaminase